LQVTISPLAWLVFYTPRHTLSVSNMPCRDSLSCWECFLCCHCFGSSLSAVGPSLWWFTDRRSHWPSTSAL